ncbi:hypothetical protein [Halobacillus ihumii]|uniref:hypothetical protein n=1 Tax=Halobacillus ihumii TaxID=2686092 RepID=UPI0013D73E74|nr:hypothetical protein [Halobacillus ihumii]
MKILIEAAVVIVINLFAIVPLISKTDEEDIGKNIKHLKKHQWFQNLLSNEGYRDLIIHDNYVRNTIGKFNSDKLDNNFFKTKYQRKLQNTL